MIRILIALLFVLTSSPSFSQNKNFYHPEANAVEDIAAAVKKASAEHKFVLLQAGGNWCKWCIEFHRFCKADAALDSMIQANFIWYPLNYSKENRNEAIFEQYGFPQRFGFPVFIILNEKGERIHTQNSSYLEDGKSSYDSKKVMEFLESWAPAALDKNNYRQ